MRALLGDGVLEFEDYPFRPATVRKDPRVPAASVQGWVPSTFPPSVWTRRGEVLFVQAAQKDPVSEWMQVHGVPPLEPVDVWSLLLDPFLDTEATPEQEQRSLEILASCGLSSTEVANLRREVEGPVTAVNSFAWEWVYLGQYDALSAMAGLTPWASWPPRPGYEDFYWRSMEVARRGLLSCLP